MDNFEGNELETMRQSLDFYLNVTEIISEIKSPFNTPGDDEIVELWMAMEAIVKVMDGCIIPSENIEKWKKSAKGTIEGFLLDVNRELTVMEIFQATMARHAQGLQEKEEHSIAALFSQVVMDDQVAGLYLYTLVFLADNWRLTILIAMGEGDGEEGKTGRDEELSNMREDDGEE